MSVVESSPIQYSDKAKPVDVDQERGPCGATKMQKRETSHLTANPPETAAARSSVLHGYKLVALVASLMLTFFCVAVDNTILTTAVPSITNSFRTSSEIGWYGSAYLLTASSCQILYSRFYTYFHVRNVLLSAILVFEIGSLVCATAPNSLAFICGRAIAGLGSAGIFTGSFAAATHTIPMRLQPLIVGLLGGVFGLSSIFGPLLGGVFAEKSTWRWCFYINLPIGAVTTLGLFILLNITQDLETLDAGICSKIVRFDPLGNVLLIAAVLCLLIALQWGGVTYPWSDGRVIALLTMFGALVIAMVLVEVYNQSNAMVPGRIARQRTVAAASLFAFCMGGSIFPVVYFLPIWFQGVKGYGAIESALHTLPLILSQLLATVSSGAFTKFTGYCVPLVYGSAILVPIGTGLITTWTVDASTAKWIGYQIILGLGFGCGFQQGNVAAASAVEAKDVPTAGALAFSFLFLGGAVFLNVAQNVFSKRLTSNIVKAAADLNITNLDVANIGQVGATQIKDLVPSQYLPEFLEAYNNAVTHTFLVAVIVSCVGSIGAAGMQWINLKERVGYEASKKKGPSA